MRLNRYLAASTSLSRRAADAAIVAGRVTVDGNVADLGLAVAAGQTVTLDGQPVIPTAQLQYRVVHKPVGYIVSRARQGMSPTVYDLDPRLADLQPVGRLDKDSSGLLLMSNDGQFIHEASHPRFAKVKRYELTLDRALAVRDAGRLEQGLELDDGPSRLKVVCHSGANLTVELTEGRNRQIRRTLAAAGYRVMRLHRTAFGALELGALPAGAISELPGRPAL